MNTTPIVSLFDKLYLPASKPCSIEEIIIQIRKRRWIHEIIAYRAALVAGKKEKARLMKGRLPGFTPSGVFHTGHSAKQLKSYSRVVGLDFDHVADPAVPAALFRAQKHTLGLFVSPGGEGLKVFVPVDTDHEQHAAAFAAVAAHYEQLSGLSCDRVCRDISRCCYVSDDPDAWYNPDAEPFIVSTQSPFEIFASEWLTRHPMAEGNRNQTVYRLGCEANRKGFTQVETAAFCATRLQGDDFTKAEIENALNSAYQGHKEEHSAHPTEFRTQKDIKDIGTISGEELRRTTPMLPANLTDKLPPLLRNALRFYTDGRERDMAFLAACTVLSACLPGVWGIYNRKKVYPHLYTVEVAPAANGKGCINDMRHLADRYASLIEIETRRKEEAYLQESEEWELKKSTAHKKNQPVQMADAPRKASTCYFFIPTQITKAKLLVHLAENGEIGGLMADSEIDTLVNAGKQDYGLFDDLLRKAFHHEPVASSRKTDNEMIRVDHPRLAVLLAGTPGQFPRLVPEVENGLASRLLLYTCRSEAVWQDVSSAGDAANQETYLAKLSEEVMLIAEKLRQSPLQVRLTNVQWKTLNEHFERLLIDTDLYGSDHFLSVVKRHGLMAFRLCMVFTALEAASRDYTTSDCYCSNDHFEAALSIVDVCLEHSRLLMTQLDEAPSMQELSCPNYFRRLFESLPEQFTLAEIYALAEAAGINERSVRRHLNRLEPKHIIRITRGVYRKIQHPSS